RRVAPDDSLLEGFERGDVANADVTIREGGMRGDLERTQPAHRKQDDEQHRHDREAGADRELEQREPAARRHPRPRAGTLTLRQSASSATLTMSEVIPKLTNGNVTPVNGITARLPETVTASWQSASTTHVTASQLRKPCSSLTRRDDSATRRGSPGVRR